METTNTYTIETLSYSGCRIVRRGDVKAALLFPPIQDGAPYVLYPHPGTYPGLTFAGLPAPLQPGVMRFATLEAVYAFLGLPAQAAALAA